MDSAVVSARASNTFRRCNGSRRFLQLQRIKAVRGYEKDESIRVLCLHGKGNNAKQFESKLEPLISRFGDKTEWNFLQAPFEMSRSIESSIISSSNDAYQWWILPERKRSFEALSYIGADTSINMVESYIEQNCINTVVGHSQGAMLLAIILARRRLRNINGDRLPLGAIISSPAWPLPYRDVFDRLLLKQRRDHSKLHLDGTRERSPSIIFTVGTEDRINPPSHTREIAETFHIGGNERTLLLEHAGGHVLPMDKDSLQFYHEHIFSKFLLQ